MAADSRAGDRSFRCGDLLERSELLDLFVVCVAPKLKVHRRWGHSGARAPQRLRAGLPSLGQCARRGQQQGMAFVQQRFRWFSSGNFGNGVARGSARKYGT
eukprot:5594785-Prymnesium_polylepis.2